jgi:hypothetical protein|eukprot:COSAG02_NODE_3244_length_7106_cov_5.600400_1_plen_242_part_00
MFGFLWDVIAFDPEDMSSAKYYYDVPRDYVHNKLIPDNYFTLEISFEYGPTHPDCPGVAPGHHHEPEGAMCAASSARDIFKSARTPFSNPGWMGVSEFLHPVFKLHYPKDAMPNSLPKPASFKGSPTAGPFTSKKVWWGINLFMDPHFLTSQGGASKEFFDSYPDAYSQEANPEGIAVLEYHMPEDFNLDWTPVSKWSGFYEFFKHGVRDVYSAKSEEGRTPEWARYVPGVSFEDDKVGWW